MKEPRRLLDQTSDILALGLLRSWRTNLPGPGAVERATAALGAAATLTATSAKVGATAVATATSAKAGAAAAVASVPKVTASAELTALFFAKWCAVGLASGLVALGSVHGAGVLLRSMDDAERPPPAAARRAPARSVPANTPASEGTPLRDGRVDLGSVADAPGTMIERPSGQRPELALPDGVPSLRLNAAREPALRSDSGSPSIAREIAALDRIRHALRARDPERALQLLDEYESRRPSGTFAPEAAQLRTEALTALERDTVGRAPSRDVTADDPSIR